jgi:peptidoglycan/LPS O-acetylase OafA/YrhL
MSLVGLLAAFECDEGACREPQLGSFNRSLRRGGVLGLLRLFLAAVVAMSHFTLYILRPIDPVTGIVNYLTLGLDAGHAVIFFYVISGFLISFALENKYGDRFFEFYRSRFLRIFPLFWVLYGTMIALDYGMSRPNLETSVLSWLPGFTLLGSDWVICFFHYPAEYWGVFPPFLRPAWSLGAELTFYALAPFLLVRFPKLCLVAFSGSVAIRAALVHQFGYDETWTFHFFPSTLMFFLSGHYARLIYRRFTHRLGSLNYLWLVLFFGISFLNKSRLLPFDGLIFYIELIAFVLAIPFLFERTKDSRALNFLGDLSYPLYLSHLITMSMLQYIPSMAPAIYGTGKPTLFLGLPVQARFIVYTVMFLSCCIAASVVLHRCVEAPIASVLARLFRRRWWAVAPVPAA